LRKKRGFCQINICFIDILYHQAIYFFRDESQELQASGERPHSAKNNKFSSPTILPKESTGVDKERIAAAKPIASLR